MNRGGPRPEPWGTPQGERARGKDQSHDHGLRWFALFLLRANQRTEVLFPEFQTHAWDDSAKCHDLQRQRQPVDAIRQKSDQNRWKSASHRKHKPVPSPCCGEIDRPIRKHARDCSVQDGKEVQTAQFFQQFWNKGHVRHRSKVFQNVRAKRLSFWTALTMFFPPWLML